MCYHYTIPAKRFNSDSVPRKHPLKMQTVKRCLRLPAQTRLSADSRTCLPFHGDGARNAPIRRWSGKRGSNPPPLPWQGSALPNELFPHIKFSVRRKYLPDFFFGIRRKNSQRIFSARWCGRRDSNSYTLRHRNLNPARLPIPPRPQLLNRHIRVCSEKMVTRRRFELRTP